MRSIWHFLTGWVRIKCHFWKVGWEFINRRHFWEVAWIKGSVQGDKSKFFCGKSLNTKKVFLFYYIQSGHGTNDYIVSKSVSKSYTAMFRDRWSVSIYCTVYIFIYYNFLLQEVITATVQCTLHSITPLIKNYISMVEGGQMRLFDLIIGKSVQQADFLINNAAH